MNAFNPILDILRYALTFMIVLPVLVAVHELGHFWVARLFGMHVDAFAVMMGGVRKTNLESYLPKPISPVSRVWIFGLVSLAVLVSGVVLKSVPMVYVGLTLVGIVFPVWVVTRLGALYHLSSASSIGVLLKAWGLAIVLSFAATRGQGLDPNQLLGLASIASFLGLLIVYYNPVFRKSEDAPQGHGQIEIDQAMVSQDKADENGVATSAQMIPVSFRPLLSRTDKHGTEFSLLCWPLGGFCAIKGMHPKENGSETLIEGGMYSKPPFARFCVLLAGPLFSVLFGVVIFSFMFAITGRPENLKDPVIGRIETTTVAYLAGLRMEDRFISVNGKPVKEFFDVVKVVRTSLKKEGAKTTPIPVELVIDRNGKEMAIKVVPKIDEQPTVILDDKMVPTGETAIQAKLGIGPKFTNVPLSAGEAIGEASKLPGAMVAGIISTFSKPATIADNIGGPVAIAQQLGKASEDGLSTLLGTAGLLSISLGIMNLLPILPFDGGQIVIALAEMLRGGRRLSIKLQSALSTVGFFLICALMITVVTLDISRFAK